MLGENPQTGNLLEVNPEKTKYMIMSRDQNIVRNGNIKIGNLSFEEVEQFKYLGATVTNINDTREEIKHRINMGNACYYSVGKLSLSSLLSKKLEVRIYKTVILPVVLYGCETWTLTLKEKHRLRVFENKVLRKIFGAKRDEVTGEWRKLHNKELHALYSSPDIIRNIKSMRLRWAEHVAQASCIPVSAASDDSNITLVVKTDLKAHVKPCRCEFDLSAGFKRLRRAKELIGILSCCLFSSKAISFTRKRNKIVASYTLGGETIPEVNKCKYLGITFSSDLGWGEHVTDTAGKAWRALHFVMRVLRKGSDKSKEIAYKSLVRPVMEYGAACWDPYRLEHIKTLEKIQKRALKCCRKNSPLKWDTLTDRRTRIRLCALFKTYRVKNYVVSVKCVVSVKKYVVSVKCVVSVKRVPVSEAL
ncbi:hypothetical protein ANN_05819 [Periplaneta americana]|uniref:Uncharacterized protein n=1 Tax=Periplaneta americana TaxID=6978 RepID=A0ABQ8TEB2_PERAM|nr:hypothetical protein ANN_05819 [Periplaneta americana]